MTYAQYALPKWYGARGMAYFLMAMSGKMGIGSALWGLFADQTSLRYSFYAAGIFSVVMGFVLVNFLWIWPKTIILKWRPTCMSYQF